MSKKTKADLLAEIEILQGKLLTQDEVRHELEVDTKHLLQRLAAAELQRDGLLIELTKLQSTQAGKGKETARVDTSPLQAFPKALSYFGPMIEKGSLSLTQNGPFVNLRGLNTPALSRDLQRLRRELTTAGHWTRLNISSSGSITLSWK